MNLRYKILPGGAPPRYTTDGAAGLDLCAAEDAQVPPHSRRRVYLGVCVEIPPGCYGQLLPRSGLAHRQGLYAITGTIDSDYRGEIAAVMVNTSPETYRVRKGQRIAQLVVVPYARVELEEVEQLTTTVRGENGFGSTGE